MAKRQLSEQAQVAKLIRQFCKSLGIKCRATSSSYSMGDSVNWQVNDLDPDTYKKIEQYAAQFQYGSFNGMEDIYEYTNNRDDIPQSKYVHGRNNYSDELQQEAWAYIHATYNDADEYPAIYKEVPTTAQVFGDWASTIVYRVLNGAMGEFWAKREIVVTEPKQQAGSVTIEEHTHTKKGFQMFIVILADFVDRDRFNELRDNAKALGGWYSRKWGTTPCGFAFKDLASAERFVSENFTAPDPDKPTGEPIANAASQPAETKASPEKATKLRAIADRLQAAIDSKFADRQENTPKRVAQAAHARLEGHRLTRTQQALNKLADLHDAGNVPTILAKLTTKKAVYKLMGSAVEHVSNGYHGYHVETGKPSNETPEALALWALLDSKSAEEKQGEALRQKITGLQFANIPGYFPTPDPVLEAMLEYANVQPDHSVLEPSAGAGSICDAIKHLCARVDAIEVNYTLADILKDKGHNVTRADFLDFDGDTYDRVIMNPPFENQADIDHVLKAYDLLSPGGRLVSVMSPSPFFRENKKSVEFRDFVDSVGGEVISLPGDSFKQSGTGVDSRLVILDKE